LLITFFHYNYSKRSQKPCYYCIIITFLELKTAEKKKENLLKSSFQQVKNLPKITQKLPQRVKNGRWWEKRIESFEWRIESFWRRFLILNFCYFLMEIFLRFHLFYSTKIEGFLLLIWGNLFQIKSPRINIIGGLDSLKL
jgi:hypothetical protein